MNKPRLLPLLHFYDGTAVILIRETGEIAGTLHQRNHVSEWTVSESCFSVHAVSGVESLADGRVKIHLGKSP